MREKRLDYVVLISARLFIYRDINYSLRKLFLNASKLQMQENENY